jgi:hypothetical protein
LRDLPVIRERLVAAMLKYAGVNYRELRIGSHAESERIARVITPASIKLE